MFIDASALVAILVREPEADALLQALAEADRRLTSPVAIYETVVALMRLRGLSVASAEEQLRRFLATTEIEIIPITEEIGRAALDAFDRYGKGRHPARLNMGDCFAYGAARALGAPLLYKGEDFASTELGEA